MNADKSSAIERKARLGAALRENLKRRKAQARRRAALKPPQPGAVTPKTKDQNPAP